MQSYKDAAKELAERFFLALNDRDSSAQQAIRGELSMCDLAVVAEIIEFSRGSWAADGQGMIGHIHQPIDIKRGSGADLFGSGNQPRSVHRVICSAAPILPYPIDQK